MEMREHWGFGVTGFKYFDAATGKHVKRGPSFGRVMEPQEAPRGNSQGHFTVAFSIQ